MGEDTKVATTLFGQLGTFKPEEEEWSNYEERMDEFFIVNKIKDDRAKVALFLTSAGSEHYGLLKNLLSPDKPSSKKYDEIIQVLKEHFEPKPLIIAERFKFHKRDQMENESGQQYFAALKSLTKNCEFGQFLEESLRDRFVCGLIDGKIQKRLLSEFDLKIKKALAIVTSWELANKDSKLMKTETSLQVLNKISPKQKSTGDIRCHRCGGNHFANECKFGNVRCYKCGRNGHISRFCRQKEGFGTQARGAYNHNNRGRRNDNFGRNVNAVTEEQHDAGNYSEETEAEDVHFFGSVNSVNNCKPIKIDLNLNSVAISMELDTGASVSIINYKMWKMIGGPILNKTNVKLQDYSGNKLKVLGEVKLTVKYMVLEKYLTVYVVEGNGPALFGRNWLSEFKLDWQSINKNCINKVDAECQKLSALLKDYDCLFEDRLGCIKNIKADIQLKENAIPKFCKYRPIPFALREKIDMELDRLVEMGVMEPISFSEWAAPIVPVVKSSGAIRLCGDFKVTVNPNVKVDTYPIPRVEDLFASLRGGKSFTTLDLSEAYLQMQLSDESKSFMVINTHRGLYRYNRLCFGVNSAPALFQKCMDTILQGLNGVICYLDDVLITGIDEADHLRNLEAVFERFRENDVILKMKKCCFMKSSVEYLGHVIDANGLHTNKKKVEAVLDMAQPKNVSELRSFLGLVNYYGKFISKLVDKCKPLHRLLQNKVQFDWDENCHRSFVALKQALSESPVLCHFNQSLPVGLACDASSSGLGAVIYHIFEDGRERPIAYASKTLNSSEQKYSQIEKEGLGIVFGLKKIHQYLYGRKFVLVTDHKPLLSIFGPHKGIPVTTANRLQRWAILLSGYDYTIRYKASECHANADTLSRLPLMNTDSSFNVCEKAIKLIYANQLGKLPITHCEIAEATSSDPILSKVCQFVQNGWPRRLSNEFVPYKSKSSDICIEQGCLMWGCRVIVPLNFRKSILQTLHDSHPGIVRTKSLARMYVWWPGITKDIENLVKRCDQCNLNQQNPKKAPLHVWEYPARVWQRIHIDYAGPFKGFMWLIVVDARTKWLEVIKMKVATTRTTVDALLSIFARFGNPECIVSDNGSPFSSYEFQHFCKENSIIHKFSPPYHPSSNGEAEINVKTFKNAMKRVDNNGDLYRACQSFLFNHRNTPHSATGVPPVELMLGRKVRTKLSVISPKFNFNDYNNLRENSNNNISKTFCSGDLVWVRGYGGRAKWLPGTIKRRLGKMTYEVKVDEESWHRHVDQMRSRIPNDIRTRSEEDDSHMYFNIEGEDDSVRADSTRVPEPSTIRRHPQRPRRPPVTFAEEFNY